MKKILLSVVMIITFFVNGVNCKAFSIERNIGIAKNNHFVQFLNGEGYYIEEDNLIKENDVVYITDDGNIYIVDHIKEDF